MKSIFLMFLLSSTFGGIAGDRSDTSSFVLVKKSNGIALYERWYSLTQNQLAREVKATFLIKAPVHAAVALIRDESQGTKWNKHTRVYRIMPANDDGWFGYIEYDLPWPVNNQDCVLRYRRISSPNQLRIEFKEADHPLFPIQKRIQRIPEISGKWVFRAIRDGVQVEYFVSTTPNPALPTWLTDPIIRNNLLETLSGFRQLLEQPRITDSNH